MRLYQTKQIRELDRIAIQEFGIAGYALMQRAGTAVLEALLNHWPKVKSIIVVCGKGNNAGDGYVIAQLAQEKKITVKVLYLCAPEKLSGDAKIAAQECIKSGVLIKPYDPKELVVADVIIDALLGIGLQGEVQEEFKAAITAINSSRIDVLAVDVPSGLDADTGNPLGMAIKAQLTVTFVGYKQGLFTGLARDYCGEIIFSDLDIPKDVYNRVESTAELLTLEKNKKYLPPRPRAAHKGAYGHVLVLGGDYGMAGAVRMAGVAAARVGAGLTTIATRPEHVAAINGACPELMCYGINTAQELQKLLAKATVLVIGPGLGNSSWSKELWRVAMENDAILKIVDADALNLLAVNQHKSTNWILTPHPGEAGRLLQCQTAEIQRDRFAAICKLQKNYGGTCVLKGSGSLILGDSGKIGVCPFGNPGMAKGGMGDILSGIIGGFLAQGLALEIAGQLGVLVHAKAADLAVQKQGERGLLATDLLDYFGELVN